MALTRGITFRLDLDLIHALKARGTMNDRSANGELSAILKEVLNTKRRRTSLQAIPTPLTNNQ